MPGKGGASKASADNRSNQMNPNNSAYSSSRGGSGAGPTSGGAGSYESVATKATNDNHSNQLNPNNPTYESSRAGH